MKEFGTPKNIIDKMAAMRTLTFFSENFDIFQACINKKGLCLFYDSAYTADQLLPQLLMEILDTLYTQCKCIEHMHEGVCL